MSADELIEKLIEAQSRYHSLLWIKAQFRKLPSNAKVGLLLMLVENRISSCEIYIGTLQDELLTRWDWHSFIPPKNSP